MNIVYQVINHLGGFILGVIVGGLLVGFPTDQWRKRQSCENCEDDYDY